MHRTFETSTTRRQRSLGGQWAFAPDPDGEFDGPGDLPADPDTIPVPCAWNALPEYYDIVGERPRDGQKWSEPYQADLLEETVATFLNTEFLAGFTVWQFCDTRTSPKRWQDRPRTKNNKGIVGEYRTPKEAYRRLERLLTDSGNGGEED